MIRKISCNPNITGEFTHGLWCHVILILHILKHILNVSWSVLSYNSNVTAEIEAHLDYPHVSRNPNLNIKFIFYDRHWSLLSMNPM